jgi:hypothetical protein
LLIGRIATAGLDRWARKRRLVGRYSCDGVLARVREAYLQLMRGRRTLPGVALVPLHRATRPPVNGTLSEIPIPADSARLDLTRRC